MTFGAVWAFYFFAAAAAVVALYILKVKRRREGVPSVLFWLRLVRQTTATSLFKKLKRLLSLLLQLLILTLLIWALTNPILGSALLKRESIVVIVDSSASMKTLEGSRTRFELARKALARLIDAKGYEDEMMILLAAGRVSVACPFTRSAKKLAASAESLAPSNTAAGLSDAFDLACELLAGGKGGKGGKKHPVIYIISDGSAGEVAGLLDKNSFTHYHQVGHERRNVGIVAFEARKNTGLMSDFLFARVKNYSPVLRTCSLELFVNGELKSAQAVELPPGGELSKTFPPFSLPEGALVRLHLDTEDALSLDDDAYGIIRPTRVSRVILVSPAQEEFYFRASLSAMGDAIDPDSPILSPEEYAALSPEDRRADITILNSCELTVSDVPGNVIALNMTGGELPVRVLGQMENPVVTDWERDHMITRYITFARLFLKKAQKVAMRRDGRVLLRSNAGPLIVLFEEKRKVVYLAFNVLDSDLPFRVAFPSLLRNIMTYFEQEEHALLRSSYRTGEVIFPARRLPGDVTSVSIARVQGVKDTSDLTPENVTVADGSFLFANTGEPGYYRITVGERNYFTTVNLPPGESDITPVEARGKEGELAWASVLGREFWLYFALAGLALFLVEWFLFNRRITE